MRNNPDWRAGYKAYDTGKNLWDNPNEPNSEAADNWHQGWQDCQEDYTPVEAPDYDYDDLYYDRLEA